VGLAPLLRCSSFTAATCKNGGCVAAVERSHTKTTNKNLQRLNVRRSQAWSPPFTLNFKAVLAAGLFSNTAVKI